MIKGHIFGTGTYFYLSQESMHVIPALTDSINSISTADTLPADGQPGQRFLIISVTDEVCDYLDRIKAELKLSSSLTVGVGFVPWTTSTPCEMITGIYLDHYHSKTENGLNISAGICFSMTKRQAIAGEERKLREMFLDFSGSFNKESEETNNG